MDNMDNNYPDITVSSVPAASQSHRHTDPLDDALEDLGLFDPDDCEDNPIMDEFYCTESEHNGCNGRCN